MTAVTENVFWFCVLTCFIAIQFHNVYTADVIINIEPYHRLISPHEEANVSCTVEFQPFKCRFNITNTTELYEDGTLPQYLWNDTIWPSNYTCQLKLQNLTEGQYVVGCRMRAKGKGWLYRYTMLLVSSDNVTASENFKMSVAFPSRPPNASSSQTQLIQEEVVFAPPNTSISVNCTPTANGYCHFPSSKQRHKTELDDISHTCGATYLIESQPLLIRCKKNDTNEVKSKMVVTIVTPTSPPRLELPERTYKVGDRLEANCTAVESVPPANIKWYIGNEEIHDEDVDEVADERWRWSWTAEGRKQTLRKKLTSEDLNKNVTCVLEQLGLNDSSMSNTAVIRVKGAEEDVPDASSNIGIYVLAALGSFIVVSLFAVFIFWRLRGEDFDEESLHGELVMEIKKVLSYDNKAMDTGYEEPIRVPCPLPRPVRSNGVTEVVDMQLNHSYLQLLQDFDARRKNKDPTYEAIALAQHTYVLVKGEENRQSAPELSGLSQDDGPTNTYNSLYDHLRREPNRPLPDIPAEKPGEELIDVNPRMGHRHSF